MDENHQTPDQNPDHWRSEEAQVIIEPKASAAGDPDFVSDQRAWFTKGARPFESLVEILKEKRGARPRSKSEKPKIQVNTRTILQDLRQGLDDQVIMEKHSLSLRQLQKLYRKMIKSGLLTPMEISNRLCVTTSQIANTFRQAADLIQEHSTRESLKGPGPEE
jgi:hypothetical protein